MKTSWLIPLTLGSALALAAACGSSNDDTDTTGVLTASGGTGAAGGSSGPGTGGEGATFSSISAGGSGGNEGCLTTESEATESPLDIIVLLDRSGSMTGNLWTGSVGALSTFFNSPGGANISAGLNFFPPSDQLPECQPNSYNPLDAPVVDLATSAATLDAAMQAESPAGAATPTWAALFGTLQYANLYQDMNPDHVVVVVLASDGDPTSCNTNITDIGSLASTALAYNGVKTFVVAIQGATVANLDQIAAAGGTMQAIDITNDITLFAQKMDEIRAQVIECEFVIPDPTSGDPFDPTKLNISYDAGGMGMPQDIPQVASLNDCAGGNGWYYDNPAAPTKVLLCPALCQTVQGDTMAKVSFVFGCPTIVK